MGDYVTSKKDMLSPSQVALKAVQAVQSVIDDADLALNDKSRRMSDSPIGEDLADALGVGVGAGIGFAGLYLGGSVAGLSAAGIASGLAAGIGVLAFPAVLLGGIGMGVASHVKNEKLREAKELIYKNAIATQTAIIKVLEQERDADKERIDYLTSLNIRLRAAIKDFEHDLGIMQAS